MAAAVPVAERNIEVDIGGREGQNMEDCRFVGKTRRVACYVLGETIRSSYLVWLHIGLVGEGRRVNHSRRIVSA